MNDTISDRSRQDADLTRYSMMVAEAVAEFERQDLPTSERSVQRWCSDGRLSCIRIDPDTRQPTDKQNFVYLIDPASIPDRIRQLRERADFSGGKAGVTSHDMSEHVGTRHDETRLSASSRDTDKNEGAEELQKANERIAELERENHTLTIDKGVRDGLVQQLREDREKFFAQMERFTDQLTGAHRTIGKLESELLSLQPPKQEAARETLHRETPPNEENHEDHVGDTDNSIVDVGEDSANSQQAVNQ